MKGGGRDAPPLAGWRSALDAAGSVELKLMDTEGSSEPYGAARGWREWRDAATSLHSGRIVGLHLRGRVSSEARVVVDGPQPETSFDSVARWCARGSSRSDCLGRNPPPTRPVSTRPGRRGRGPARTTAHQVDRSPASRLDVDRHPSQDVKTPRHLEDDEALSSEAGSDLLSQGVPAQVPSALRGLTAGFGMGPGVSPSREPPASPRPHRRTVFRARAELYVKQVASECGAEYVDVLIDG